MQASHEIYADNGILAATIVDYGDGTGLRIEYAADGTVTTETPLTGLPIQQTAQQSITAALETMPADAAPPVLTVLGWIATLDQQQAATLTAALTALLTQGDI